jgi:hypothetical protein
MAQELDPNRLLDALQRDDEARQRLVADEKLEREILDSRQAIQELKASLADLAALQEQASLALGGDLPTARAFETRRRTLQSQHTQSVEQLRAALRKAVTGSARPLLDFSTAARLHLDPIQGHWTCAACSNVYEDPAIAGMGRMLKVKEELLLPMWNHLWTEKDDFRKSELFRTNEQVQGLIEKEASAMRDVAEQYRADMRPVRENLILAMTEAGTKREQLDSTIQGLVALGAVNGDEARESVARIASVTGGDLQNAKKRAEAKETLLNSEPEAQMQRRVPAIDPVHRFLTPEALFRIEPTSGDTLRLLTSETE